MSVEIKHPRNHNVGPKNWVPGQFLAVGTASRDIVRIEGSLTWKGSGTVAVPEGETIHMALRNRQGEVKLHWVIKFPKYGSATTLAAPGPWELKVTGYTSTNTQHQDIQTFTVKGSFAIAATYPESDADLTQEWDYFVAYGTCVHNLDEARMRPNGGSAIGPDAQDSDVVLDSWWALFPPLDNGTYELTAIDTWLHALTNPVTGLLVNRALERRA